MSNSEKIGRLLNNPAYKPEEIVVYTHLSETERLEATWNGEGWFTKDGIQIEEQMITGARYKILGE